jgi:hypothetical protein
LDVYDAVGCNYRPFADGNPQHYSGNYWWATARYISTLRIAYLRDKYDPEFWLLQNNPVYFNIHTLENMYEHEHYIGNYRDDVEHGIADRVFSCKVTGNENEPIAKALTFANAHSGNKVIIPEFDQNDVLEKWNVALREYNITIIPKNKVRLEVVKVLYGLRDTQMIDVTHIVTERFLQPNRLFVPKGTSINEVAGDDPCPGKYKQIYIEYTLNSIPLHKVFTERYLGSHGPIEISDNSHWRTDDSDVPRTFMFSAFMELLGTNRIN